MSDVLDMASSNPLKSDGPSNRIARCDNPVAVRKLNTYAVQLARSDYAAWLAMPFR